MSLKHPNTNESIENITYIFEEKSMRFVVQYFHITSMKYQYLKIVVTKKIIYLFFKLKI